MFGGRHSSAVGIASDSCRPSVDSPVLANYERAVFVFISLFTACGGVERVERSEMSVGGSRAGRSVRASILGCCVVRFETSV